MHLLIFILYLLNIYLRERLALALVVPISLNYYLFISYFLLVLIVDT